VCLTLLLAFGSAGLLRCVPPPKRRIAECAAVVVACFIALDFGVIPRVPYQFVRQRPSEEHLAFFRTLEAVGNRGPMLELPLVEGLEMVDRASAAVLLAAYHRRQTSECYNSFYQRYLPAELVLATETLPEPSALAALRRAGFTTVLVHLDGAQGAGEQLANRLQHATESDAAPLRLVGRAKDLAAFELVSTH
jgi:hypothetical protein